ncbi:hypothetical protein [Streptomyces sp. NBC_01089]|uniref:hypothetical protein n=1 Tax=Streptomyces sp. NBC_01089 TaxID=2903747 RepID=UPI00386F7408|nr:hypothetical protein OG510_35730 [Streptomyces sp. NBC_01089]
MNSPGVHNVAAAAVPVRAVVPVRPPVAVTVRPLAHRLTGRPPRENLRPVRPVRSRAAGLVAV